MRRRPKAKTRKLYEGHVIHRINSTQDFFYPDTACGRRASEVVAGNHNTWRGVNCKACLKHK
jgi:hypothetical protein